MFDLRLQSPDFLLREEWIQSCPPHAMKVMAGGTEGTVWHAVTVAYELPLVSFPLRATVDLIVEVGVVDVHFFGD